MNDSGRESLNDPWMISLFGGLSARRREQVITRFKTQKVAALFGYLAYYLRQAHSREILIELLWPGSDIGTLRNSLSVCLSSLRNQFEPPGIPQGTVLRADRFSVGLNPATVTTDVARFEQAVRAAAKADSRSGWEQRLAEAVELYQGALLPGYYEDWIAPERDRLAGVFFDAIGALVVHREGVGDKRGALEYARRAVAADPLREEGQSHVIRLLAADGQPGAALRQYKEYERLLEEHLGDEPSVALRALFRRIEKEAGFAAPFVAPTSASSPKPIPAPFGGAGGPATMTLLMSDIAGSTRLRQADQEAYTRALERHHVLLREVFARHGGFEMNETGDGFVVAFPTAGGALTAAVASQKSLHAEPWPEETGPLTVRMALHTGDIQQNADGEYQGLALQYANRMLTAAHGGQVLVSEATAGLLSSDALAAAGVHLSDLGIYRLRDVPEPKRLFQAQWPEMGYRDFGPLDAEAGHRSNLPPRFTRFFGREKEMAELADLLANPDTRLVTLTGPGGNGKTRLALEVAERQTEPFAGAMYFVPLADLADPALIAGAVLDALRVGRSPQQEPLAQAVEVLAKRPTLLVLDNFEQLVEGGAGVAQALLAGAPLLKLLLTSRQLLGLSAEREYALSPMPVPYGDETAEQLSLFDSVQLFIDRAQQVKPDFQVGNANAASIAALALGLEGIPLAIELAAARAQVLTPSQMLAQLGNRFDFLTTRKRDTAERHRTLHGAIDWSYRLLTPELQRFFCRLSVFRGGWTVEAAETVCEEPLALDYLEQLREGSLVLVLETDDGIRFRMLETLREFGWEQLWVEEKPHFARAHAEYFASVAQEVYNDLESPDGAIQAQGTSIGFRRLDAEAENLRTAFVWSQGEQGDAELGLRLPLNLARYRVVRGYWRESRQDLETAMARLPNLEGEKRLRAVDALVQTLYLLGEPEKAWPLLRESLELAQAVGTRSNVAWSLGGLGRWAEALEIFREIGEFNGQLNARQNLAYGALVRSDLATATAHLGEAMALARQGHAEPASLLGQMAVIVAHRGEYEQAIAYQAEALAFCEGTGNRYLIAECHARLGNHWLQIEEFTKARHHLTHAVEILREIGSRPAQSIYQVPLAWVALREGDTEAARRLAQESLDLAQETGRREAAALALDILGHLCLLQGQAALARPYFERSLRTLSESGPPQSIAYSLESWAHLATAERNSEDAIRLISIATALRKKLGIPLPPVNQPEQAALLAAARTSLGEEAFAAAWEAGQLMPQQEAITLALGEAESSE